MGKLQSPATLIRDWGSISEKDDEDAISNSSETVDRDIPRVLTILASVLERLIARNERCWPNDSQTLAGQKLTIFHGLRPPNISISKYLERLFKYTSCSPSCFVLGYVYIDRLVHKQPDLPVTSLNVHRLVVTAVMLATKILDDEHFDNAFFARVGGVPTLELNRLELELLFRLDFKLFVKLHEFESYCLHLDKEALVSNCKIERNLPMLDVHPGELKFPNQESPIYKSRIEFVLKQPFLRTGDYRSSA
ncbi:hypothetical protein O6H91_13G075000 [Diphasiastrum complanatum]|uniref:Uncharacterized protein n=2 Tax=Diphasiastrum complanatum TaxID=34168 RepID=A0ACC2BX74_DIPCM|nr:hypothetical protein O6H91_Y018600 [Diphasiastrum complanatum]KAJ7298071.1 hypothetical protein O6H91_Y018600 [Diphasiastrum complanatum]KAJ7534001.1 hypothetical protein O6H91_13G075000 [Diphasiastrum complanatum]KAJ7534002.1 hypothetical protein O6H91_13G075000 [Diphasiastrum complanatum]